MVRVVSASSLGYSDYGGRYSDREVDGVSWAQEDGEYALPIPPRKIKVAPFVKINGGKLLTKSKTQIR